jgi:hypothetical protein
MRFNRIILLTIILLALLSNLAGGQSAKPSSASKTTLATARKTESTASPQGAAAKTDGSATELIEQGKKLYRSQRFKPALAKFEAALALDPLNDEALGLAAVTSFRLDNQPQSREYFLRRADLLNQKDSVKAYSYYRVALTYWREVHDLVAKFEEIKEGKVAASIPDESLAAVRKGVDDGLEYAEKALAISKNFAEAHNVKNLLHAEASLAAKDQGGMLLHRRLSNESLRRAVELSKAQPGAKVSDLADFSLPTARVSEFAFTDEEESKIEDPVKQLLSGGKPVKRTQAIFPSAKPPRPGDQNDPSAKGVTSDGGAYSLGIGRGALNAAYAPGIVKIEVLISITGDVVFAHVVDGRSDLNGAAVLAARDWKFEPAKFEGKPVQVSGIITFDMKPPGRTKPTPTPAPKGKAKP